MLYTVKRNLIVEAGMAVQHSQRQRNNLANKTTTSTATRSYILVTALNILKLLYRSKVSITYQDVLRLLA